jgi:hypothetical protein
MENNSYCMFYTQGFKFVNNLCYVTKVFGTKLNYLYKGQEPEKKKTEFKL